MQTLKLHLFLRYCPLTVSSLYITGSQLFKNQTKRDDIRASNTPCVGQKFASKTGIITYLRFSEEDANLNNK